LKIYSCYLKWRNEHEKFELCFEAINGVITLLKSVEEKIANNTESIATEQNEIVAQNEREDEL